MFKIHFIICFFISSYSSLDNYEENKVKSNYVKVEASDGEEVKRVIYKVDVSKYKKYERLYINQYIGFYVNSLFSEMNEAYRIIRDKKNI